VVRPSAAWLVLLCIGLTIFAALTGYTAGRHGNALATLFTGMAATLAAMSVAWRAVHAARAAIRATQGLALARSRPRCGTRRDYRGSGDARIRHSPAAAGRRPPAVRILPLRRDGGAGPLVLDARQSFGPQFWLDATLVALCVGTVLWLALPHDLPMTRCLRATPGPSGWTP
jgi:hypothetical protein